MVTGSDVVQNASSYRKPVEEHSIHTMNHIIFRRGEDADASIDKARKLIRGKVAVVDLPPEFRDISSTMLRENIDLNRDVSNLVDPMVQGYIYASGLYLREPEYKPLVDGKVIAFEHVQSPDDALLTEIPQRHSRPFRIRRRRARCACSFWRRAHFAAQPALAQPSHRLHPLSLHGAGISLRSARRSRAGGSGAPQYLRQDPAHQRSPHRQGTSSSPIRRSFCSQRCSPKPARLAVATPCSSHRKTCQVNTSWAL